MIRLSQVHLKVRELEPAIRFYTRVLEFDVIERVGRSFASLAFGMEDSLLALHSGHPDAFPRSEAATGMGWISFEAADEETFAGIWERLWNLGIAVHPEANWMQWSFHFEDPDGNSVEIYVARRQSDDRWSWKPCPQQIPPPVAMAQTA